MITDEYVQTAYNQVLTEVLQILPLRDWAYEPSGLEWMEGETKYSLSTKEGKVFINKAFLGTTATTLLDYRLRHEFAHLAIDIGDYHNRVFKRVEKSFGVIEDNLSSEIAQIEKKLPYKYTILAHLANGEVQIYGGAQRKNKRYTEYPEKSPYTLLIKGVRIVRFEYQENPS